MNQFLVIYIITAVLVIAAVFLLSLNENKSPKIKTALTVIYILSLIGVVFAMTVLEGKYQLSRLASSGIAAAVIGLMYFADTLGGKFRKNREE